MSYDDGRRLIVHRVESMLLLNTEVNDLLNLSTLLVSVRGLTFSLTIPNSAL